MNAPPPVVVTSPGVQQGMTSQPQVVVIQAPSRSPLEMGSSQRGCVVGMGATQVAIGILCFFFQIGAFIVPTSISIYAAPGIWGPIFFVIAGAFGIAGGRKQSKGMVITFLVMSIISALIAVPAFSMAAVSLGLNHDPYYLVGDYGWAVAMDTLLLLLGLAELVIAIVSSGIGCGVLCCRNQGRIVGTVQYVNTSGQPVQYVNTAGGQTGVAQPGTVIVQPQMAGVSQPQAAYPTQQWQQGPPQQGQPAAVAGPYQPQGPPPYAQQGPVKHDLAGVHGATQPPPPSHAPPPYNPETNQGMYLT